MRRSRHALLSWVFALATIGACSSSDDADGAHSNTATGKDTGAEGSTSTDYGGRGSSATPSPVASDDGDESVAGSRGGDVPRDPSSEVAAPQGGTGQAGTLTAGVWDDNRNFDHFVRFRDATAQTLGSDALTFTREEVDAAKAAFAGPRAARQKLDLALVVDTTGSMGDELRYLQTELIAISRTMQEKYPAAEQRWALVFYRDQGDEYVTRVFDFQTDVEQVRTQLAAQSAAGGGDFPEAPDAAFAALDQLAWRSDAAVARVAFWVADAPHHAQRVAALQASIRDARKRDVHVYPVASSGVDELTELSMRSAAQLTGGRYLFLTDDSGVGNAHKEPTIPCYFVTRLDRAILRMVDAELTGTVTAPTAAEIIRSSGNVQDGVCTIAGGQQVSAF